MRCGGGIGLPAGPVPADPTLIEVIGRIKSLIGSSYRLVEGGGCVEAGRTVAFEITELVEYEFGIP